MRYLIKFTAIVSLVVLFISCQQQNAKKAQRIDPSITKIELIDFYSTHRCVTCIDIENNTKYTLDTYFKKEVDAHKIVYLTLNVDKKENYKIAEKFKTMGTALFLNVIKNGKETHVDLTDFAFLKGSDKEAFVKELKSKLEAALKNI
jgi:hypothetical protein